MRFLRSKMTDAKLVLFVSPTEKVFMFGWKMPADCAMFSAVCSLSPVIIQTLMFAWKKRVIELCTLSCSLSSTAEHPSSTRSFSTILHNCDSFAFLSADLMASL